MRELNIGTKDFTTVVVQDEPGQGGACHEYGIHLSSRDNGDSGLGRECGYISFQDGPIKEFGVNGCHHEDLLTIIIDRLEHFQRGEYMCAENALALVRIREALFWLRRRTEGRKERGVEGTHQA